MKLTATVFLVALFFVAIGCFIGGVIYADKTSNIPKEGNFEIEGYFTNIQKSDLTILDAEYPYFTKGTGANEEEAKDYKNNPKNYEEYTVEIHVTNNSNYSISPVWAVSPGYQVNSEGVMRKNEKIDIDRKIWINCWLGEGGVELLKGGALKTTLHIIVKTIGMNEQEVQNILVNMQINLQLWICGESLNPHLDISRNISFNYPLYYKE